MCDFPTDNFMAIETSGTCVESSSTSSNRPLGLYLFFSYLLVTWYLNGLISLVVQHPRPQHNLHFSEVCWISHCGSLESRGQAGENLVQGSTTTCSCSPCGSGVLPLCDFDNKTVVDPGIGLPLASLPDGNVGLPFSLGDPSWGWIPAARRRPTPRNNSQPRWCGKPLEAFALLVSKTTPLDSSCCWDSGSIVCSNCIFLKNSV